MKTVKGCSDRTLVVKKSRFIGLCCRVESEEEALKMIAERKKQHYDARHNCYAYVLENGSKRYSDDGEPQGTAGMPMLKVIESSGLSDVLVICTRYFGGTLLGTGGLVRAYTKSASDVLEAAYKIELIQCNIYRCSFSYSDWSKAESFLGDAGYMLDDTVYSDNVTAIINVPFEIAEKFKISIKDLTHGKTTPVLLGKKMAEVNFK